MAQYSEAAARQKQPLYQCLKYWLGRLDSNQGMAESKSAALPLGYAPKRAGLPPWAGRRADHSGATIANQLQ
jgi:hypothetical protein